MGRPRKSNPLNLPNRVYAKHGAFYYHHPGGRWERLGTDVEAVKKRAAEITNNLGDGFGKVPYWLGEFITACQARVKVDDMAQRTLDDYTEAAEKLGAWFKHYYPAGLEPKHVAAYLDAGLAMGRAVRANREKATLSAMFTWLIRNGKAGVQVNPCKGVKRNRETPRERYVEDDEMIATLAKAPRQVVALAHLIYRTLQRPEDIITWTSRTIVERKRQDGQMVRIIRNDQGKTGRIVDIEVTPEIDAILASLKVPPKKQANGKPQSAVVTGLTLLHRRDGHPYTYDGLCSMLKRRQANLRKVKDTKHVDMPAWGFYDMKGKGATDMWLSGVPLELIQVLCGHDSITTTERYVKARWRGIVSPNGVQIAV